MDPRRFGDFHSDLLRFTPQHSVVFALTILMMLHLLSYQQSPLQLLAVYILQFTPFSYCLPNHTGRPIHLIHAFKFHFILASFTCIQSTWFWQSRSQSRLCPFPLRLHRTVQQVQPGRKRCLMPWVRGCDFGPQSDAAITIKAFLPYMEC